MALALGLIMRMDSRFSPAVAISPVVRLTPDRNKIIEVSRVVKPVAMTESTATAGYHMMRRPVPDLPRHRPQFLSYTHRGKMILSNNNPSGNQVDKFI